MLLPILPARIKQRNRRVRYAIQGGSGGGGGFTQVATGAGKTQVLKAVAAVGMNVLDVHRLTDRILTRLTVFTTIPRAFVGQAHNSGPWKVTHLPKTTSQESHDTLDRSIRQRPGLCVNLTVGPEQPGPPILIASFYPTSLACSRPSALACVLVYPVPSVRAQSSTTPHQRGE